MHVFHRLSEIDSEIAQAGSAVAIGNFDGVHLGHRALLAHMLDHARLKQAIPTVLTFFPHPVEVLRPSTKLERLTTTSEKLALLESLGVSVTLVETFDKALSELSPEDFFVKFLVNGLKAKSLHVGFDFKFGKARAGNIDTLKALCAKHGIHLQVEQPFEKGGVKISSSALRQAVREGDLVGVSEKLMRPYLLAGPVVYGDGRGRLLGYPTANLRYPTEKVIPKNGVYVTRAHLQKQTFRSITNVGVRPTFVEGGTETRPNVEVHLLDFNARLYDEFLQIEFFDRVRDEMKFPSVEALKAQIQKDVDFARRYPLP